MYQHLPDFEEEKRWSLGHVQKSVFYIQRDKNLHLTVSHGSFPRGYSYIKRLLNEFDWGNWQSDSYEQDGYYQINLNSGESTFLGQTFDSAFFSILSVLNESSSYDPVDRSDGYVDKRGIDGKKNW